MDPCACAYICALEHPCMDPTWHPVEWVLSINLTPDVLQSAVAWSTSMLMMVPSMNWLRVVSKNQNKMNIMAMEAPEVVDKILRDVGNVNDTVVVQQAVTTKPPMANIGLTAAVY